MQEWDEAASPRVYPDDPLDAAMRWLGDGRLKALPVLSRANIRELRGTISLADALAAYSVASAERDREIPAGAPSGKFPTLLAGVAAALLGVAVLGGLVSYYYRAERGKRADQEYQAGNALLRSDRIAEAIEQYRNALSISHSAAHRLALGLALVKADRPDEASIYIREVLRQQPESGPANLAMAGIAASQGETDDAASYYRHAIAGSWPDNPAQNRTQARIQLALFLAKSGRQAQARAEVLSLAADLPNDPSLRKQVGRMLLDFGLAREAADVFRDALKQGPPDQAVYDGLGDADFRMGDYRSAREAYRHALSIDPGDQAAALRAEVCERILALDPTVRGIRAKERYRRSREILSQALTRFTACAGPESAIPAESKAMVTRARAALAGKGPSGSVSDAADADLQLAEELWAQRPPTCPSPGADDPFTLIMSRVAVR